MSASEHRSTGASGKEPGPGLLAAGLLVLCLALPAASAAATQAGTPGRRTGTDAATAAAWREEARLGILEGRAADAVVALRRALQAAPEAQAWYLLGCQLDRLGRPSEARDAYQEATRLQPDEPRYWRALGEAHEGLRQFAGAILAFQQAAGLRPSAEAWTALGRVHLAAGLFWNAVQDYTQALALAPDDLDALAGRVLASAGTRNSGAAAAALSRLKAVDPVAADEAYELAFGRPRKH
ncbi:MAG: tetratricopeptide repeat protein [Candidatus Methylomirabilales bacterium]